MANKQRSDLTFKDNIKRGRHGWVRLTPAYSVKVVQQILDQHPSVNRVLDPFSGTGTTGLVVAQLGRRGDLMDINPFLIWLAKVKCANYHERQIHETRAIAIEVVKRAKKITDGDLWFPPISNIERWWSLPRLTVLGRLFQGIQTLIPETCPQKDLLLVAFCRLIIEWSNADFNNQSMSFKSTSMPLIDEDGLIYEAFTRNIETVLASAGDHISGQVQVRLQDARSFVTEYHYDAVITSPPYVNRMSYIRELRPYMYWLGYLKEARDAGELDWQAIGGTWGIATSRLNNWNPPHGQRIVSGLRATVDEIAVSSLILSRYVQKYFSDMSVHFSNLFDVVAPGGRVYYIIGNSKFYNTLVPAEQIFAELMKDNGFEDTKINVIRKRNSKKELLEFLVSARKPS